MKGKYDCSYSCLNRTKYHSFHLHLKIVEVHMNLFKKTFLAKGLRTSSKYDTCL